MQSRSRAGNFAVQNADLVLVIGNRLSSMTTGTEFEKFAREAKIIVVDIDSKEHSKKGVKIEEPDLNYLTSIEKIQELTSVTVFFLV